MIRVDYAGPGGACEGIRSLGLDSYGIEWDAAACSTRAAAGHRTIRADLATYRPGGTPWGYWGSPPCQSFSTAGKGDGRAELDRLAETIHAERWDDADLFDSRTRHVIDAARVAVTCGAEWVAMEQVPGVLPLWSALAHVLERHGFSTWAGVLCAADYGVPQTRRRAILMASRVRVAMPPTPTHAETPVADLFGTTARWVSMADALGWDGTVDRRQQSDGVPVRLVPTSEPAPTLTGIAGSKCQWLIRTNVAAGEGPGERPIHLTPRDALILQGFEPDYPVQGSRSKQFEQIGNAAPAPLAAAIVGALIGRNP